MRISKSLVLVVAMAACGGDDGPKEGMTNPQQAKASVTQVSTVNTQMGMMSGAGVSSAVQAMTAANQGIVQGGAGRANELLGLIPTSFPKTGISNAAMGTADCTATGCTFTQYGEVGYLIDGTITRSGDTVTFDLTYDITSQAQQLHWEIDGTLTLTATSIDGEVHTKGDTSGAQSAGYNVKWDIDVDYNAVTINAAGCPTAGSVHAVSSYNVSAGGQSATGYNVQGTVTFDGTGC